MKDSSKIRGDEEFERRNKKLVDLIKLLVIEIHLTLGFGFQEKVYQEVLEIELDRYEIKTSREYSYDIIYKDKIAGTGRLDFLINDLLDKKDKYEKLVSKYPQSAVCPAPPKGHGCGRKASGYNEVVQWFGYRGKAVQSLCRECRSKQARKYRTKKY